jgi:hypothetical protein
MAPSKIERWTMTMARNTRTATPASTTVFKDGPPTLSPLLTLCGGEGMHSGCFARPVAV